MAYIFNNENDNNKKVFLSSIVTTDNERMGFQFPQEKSPVQSYLMSECLWRHIPFF